VTAKSGVASSVCSRMRKLPRRFSVADMLVSFRVQIANYKGPVVSTWLRLDPRNRLLLDQDAVVGEDTSQSSGPWIT